MKAKRFLKAMAIIAILAITSSFFMACAYSGREGGLQPPGGMFRPSFDNATTERIENTIEAAIAQILTGMFGDGGDIDDSDLDWEFCDYEYEYCECDFDFGSDVGFELPQEIIDTLTSTISTNLIEALRNAHIGPATVNTVLDATELLVAGDKELDEFAETISVLEHNGIAVAFVIYYLASGIRGEVETIAETLDMADMLEYIEQDLAVLDAILYVGRDTFTRGVGTMLHIYGRSMLFNVELILNLTTGEFGSLSQEEFRSLFLATIQHEIESMQLLTPQAVEAMAQVLSAIITATANTAAEAAPIIAALDEFVETWPQIRTSLLAMLHSANNSAFANAIHNATFGDGASEDLTIILIARMLNAGFNANGGIDEQFLLEQLGEMFGDYAEEFLQEIFAELNELASLPNNATIDWTREDWFLAIIIRDIVRGEFDIGEFFPTPDGDVTLFLTSTEIAVKGSEEDLRSFTEFFGADGANIAIEADINFTNYTFQKAIYQGATRFWIEGNIELNGRDIIFIATNSAMPNLPVNFTGQLGGDSDAWYSNMYLIALVMPIDNGWQIVEDTFIRFTPNWFGSVI